MLGKWFDFRLISLREVALDPGVLGRWPDFHQTSGQDS